MWIVTVSGGFVSLVQDRDDATKLQVRARVPEDISATFPGAEVFIIPGADYRYRARVDQQEAAQKLAEAVLAIDYDSHFKDVALQRSPADPERYNAYYGTWSAMARMQDFAPYSTTARAAERWDEDVDDDTHAHDSRWWR